MANRDRLVATFVDLAKISSPSWKEGEVIRYISKRLDRIGVDCEKHPCGESHNLLARIPGDESRTPVLFSCHMDTVVPCENINPVVSKTKITSDGTTILGADDKAAVAAFIEALTSVRESKLPHGPLEFIFSCAEEVGLLGIKGFDIPRLRSKFAYVFDSGGEIGRVILRAPFHITLNISVTGKSAHAGMEPEKGLSAIRVISEIVTRIPHGRIDNETTVNIGIIAGGSATNIVAEEAHIELEARSLDRAKLNDVEEDIRMIVESTAREFGAKVRIKRNMEYTGFSIRESDPVVKLVRRAFSKIGIEPRFESSGGGSDTNIFNRAGVRAINLSIGMRNVHTKKEFIFIRDLVDGARLVEAIIESA